MSKQNDKSERANWAGAAALAGAALGSAALAAVLLYGTRAKEKPTPSHPEDAPETD
ncbi:MAG: hypothetical protein KGJ57_14050 [Sphingomonadales bacterium]|nr:hypothetical protein [Sphingomonadales bacterium]MDE2170527.1 hypothetical protein [Sphingomonadales bacterium]